VGGLGDVNGDGISDFFISAPGGERRKGVISVYLGGKTLAEKPWASLSGPVAGGELGMGCAPAGDMNGDGYMDLIAGSPALGQALLYVGGPQGMQASPWSAGEAAPFERLGSHVALLGDSSGDGRMRLIVVSEAYSGHYERQ
jgi:hypothetical protein